MRAPSLPSPPRFASDSRASGAFVSGYSLSPCKTRWQRTHASCTWKKQACPARKDSMRALRRGCSTVTDSLSLPGGRRQAAEVKAGDRRRRASLVVDMAVLASNIEVVRGKAY